ncbi:MAG: magnesium/cobalt transporter CorA [Xenophilus sp.]
MLINCAAYRHGRKLADIDVGDIPRHLAQPGCFVWVALQDATAEELAPMRQAFGLHPLAVEDALGVPQRPKVEEYGDSLFVVMQLLDPDGEGERRRLRVGEVDVFAGPNYLLSVRRRSAQSLAQVRQRCEREPELLEQGPGFVLYALMDEVVDRYFPVIEQLEEQIEAIEKAIFTEDMARRATIHRLYALKRRLRVLKHAVAPLLEAAGRLYGGRVPPLCAGTQAYYRDVVDHLQRIHASVETIREGIATAIQVNLSLVTIEDGEVTKRLAAWAAIFAACTAFAGIWGMNFQVMPELKWHFGYPMALGVMAAVCGVLYWRFRRAGWL